MIPFIAVACPLAAIGIGSLFAVWNRWSLQRTHPHDQVRERVAYLMWVAAMRIPNERA
jgi:hypothetical protein